MKDKVAKTNVPSKQPMLQLLKPHLHTILLITLVLVALVFEFLKSDYGVHQRHHHWTYNDVVLHDYEVSEAARMQPKSGQILCWIATYQKNHKSKVRAVHNTWTKRCDSINFLTDSAIDLPTNISYHTIFKKLPPFYLSLFWKTRLALYYIYSYISKDFDWYLKADDDTYVFIDNLRKYLSNFDPSKPYYLGYRMKLRAPKHGYNSGSAYVLSRGAMRIYAKQLFNNPELCPFHLWEDLGLAKCLEKFAIYPEDTRDDHGRQRFFAFRPAEHRSGNLWKEAIFDEIDEASKNIFHENVISFHHLTADDITMLETEYEKCKTIHGTKDTIRCTLLHF